MRVIDPGNRSLGKPEWGALLNMQDSLCQGLARYWHFAEGQGKRVADVRGDGALSCLTATNCSWAAGPVLAFNGTSSYADETSDVGIPGLLSTSFPYGAASVMCWFKPTASLSSGNFGTLLCNWDDGGGGFAKNNIWGLFTYSDGTVYWAYNSNNVTNDVDKCVTSNTYGVNSWNHVVATFTNTPVTAQISVQLNGTLTTTQNVWFSNSATGSPGLTLGCSRTGNGRTSNLYQGHILQAAVWNRALDKDEMQRLYYQPWSVFAEQATRRLYTIPPAAPNTPPWWTQRVVYPPPDFGLAMIDEI